MEARPGISKITSGLTTLAGQQCGARVSEVAEVYRRQSRVLQERLEEAVSDVGEIDDGIPLCGEDETARLVEAAHTLHLFQLAGGVGLQGANGASGGCPGGVEEHRQGRARRVANRWSDPWNTTPPGDLVGESQPYSLLGRAGADYPLLAKA